MNKKTCIFIIFLVISFISNAQLNKNGDFEINNFNTGEIRLEGWKYISDDNPEYANPNYNDSDWQQFASHDDFRQFMDSEFSGFGWFRLKIIIADSLKDQIFALSIFQAGAMQIFANGTLTESLGKPSENQSDEKLVYTELRPFAVKFNSDTVVLAIKYSRPLKDGATTWHDEPCCSHECYRQCHDYARCGPTEPPCSPAWPN